MGKSKAIRSTGAGASTPHAAAFTDPGYFADDLSNPRHMANCTLGGEPIPEHLWSKLMYSQTDQGAAEFEEKNRDLPKPVVEIVRDELHQGMRRRGGDLDRGMTSRSQGVVRGEDIERGIRDDEAYDERRELVLAHVPEGMHPCFLDAKRISEGTHGGYEVAKVNGKPVTHGTSVLGYIPEELAQARQAGFERKSHEAQSEIYAGDPVQQERVSRGGTPVGRFENPRPAASDFGLQSDLDGGDDLNA